MNSTHKVYVSTIPLWKNLKIFYRYESIWHICTYKCISIYLYISLYLISCYYPTSKFSVHFLLFLHCSSIRLQSLTGFSILSHRHFSLSVVPTLLVYFPVFCWYGNTIKLSSLNDTDFWICSLLISSLLNDLGGSTSTKFFFQSLMFHNQIVLQFLLMCYQYFTLVSGFS